ncbi:hypothetical protein EC988_004256 [Linderina pennispora]|nr:hypothetical protein EC988_004256 [Linderina pennispora]
MEIRLDDFSSSTFDVKQWLNAQFSSASPDPISAENRTDTLSQKLTTQLHFLATNSQQSNDRIKARFRHQAPQIARDIASLSKLVQETQVAISAFSKTIDAQSLSANALERVVNIETVRGQLEKSVSAMEYFRDYADFPKKIQRLVDEGDVEKAWELMDRARAMSKSFGEQPGENAVDIGASEQKVRDMAVTMVEAAIKEQDADKLAGLRVLLDKHESGDIVRPAYVRVTTDLLTERLAVLLADAADSSSIDAALDYVSEAVVRERGFMELAGIDGVDQVLEGLLVSMCELLHPSIQAILEASDAVFVFDMYESMVGLWVQLDRAMSDKTLCVGGSSEEASGDGEQVPESLRLLLEPFIPYLTSFVDKELDGMRTQYLEPLQQIEFGRIEPYTKQAGEIIKALFAHLNSIVERAFILVPTTRLDAGVASIAQLVADASSVVSDRLAETAQRFSIPRLALDFYDDLSAGNPDEFGTAIYGSLTSEDKLDAASAVVGLSVLGRHISESTGALGSAIARLWSEHLGCAGEAAIPVVECLRESCQTTMELSAVLEPVRALGLTEGLSQLREAPGDLSCKLSAAVVFLLTSGFRSALQRLPGLPVWHAVKQSRSNMNIEVPTFSVSPTEEAVELGEKMHILLPELEQLEVMDMQQSEQPPVELYTFVLVSLDTPCDASTGGLAIHAMLAFVLQLVLRNTVQRVGEIRPPITSDGRRQIEADVEYISSVARSFTAECGVEFDELQSQLAGDPVPGDSAATGLAERLSDLLSVS